MSNLMNKTNRKFQFWNDEAALIFTATVNGLRADIGHYARALVRTDITPDEVAFLSKQVQHLHSRLVAVMTAA